FLDGRDTPPRSAAEYLETLRGAMQATAGGDTQAVLATFTGRYFAMDRDRRWDRTRLAYDAMVHGAGRPVQDPVAAVREGYERGETDEFVKPLVVMVNDRPAATIRDGDGIFCINFRADRMRQIVRALGFEEFDGFER